MCSLKFLQWFFSSRKSTDHCVLRFNFIVAEGYESRVVVLDCARDMHSPLRQSESFLDEAGLDKPFFIMVGSFYVGHDTGLGALTVSFRFVVLCNQ